MDALISPQKRTDVAVYVRVSTDLQELEHQRASCERYCSYKNLTIGTVYKDIGSGKEYRNRPGFLALRDDLRAMKYDGLVVFRLDRLFRNVVEAVNFIQEWDKRGIKLYSINENFDTSTAMGRAMMNFTLVLAQLERENISEATKARLDSLRADGVKLGRPQVIPEATIEKIALLRGEGKSIRHIAEQLGLKVSTTGKYAKMLSINGGV